MDISNMAAQRSDERGVLGMHEIDNKLFVAFFGYLLNKFKQVFSDNKRFNWRMVYKANYVELFFRNIFSFKSEEVFKEHEALLFKLIFSTYSKSHMEKCGFDQSLLNEQWDCIDRIRKRKRNFRMARKFFEIDTIRKLWFEKNGFFKSKEMKDFIRMYVKNNSEYLTHFMKFCDISWLNISSQETQCPRCGNKKEVIKV